MYNRVLSICWVVALLLFAGSGCKKAAPPGAVIPAQESPGQLLARIHWLGKERLAAETNATFVMSIWNLPESSRLEAQTLDKMATAPWRLLLNRPDTNVPSAQLRPLLEDLVKQEWYFEMRQPTNEPAQAVLAVRANKDRSLLWEKNLRTVMESLTGLNVAPNASGGWSLKKHHAPSLMEFAQVPNWTVVGLAENTNLLMNHILARLKANAAAPFSEVTNFWLTVELDPQRTISGLSHRWSLPPECPRIAMNWIGDGDGVKTTGMLYIDPQLQPTVELLKIPTNLLHDPIVSFTVVQGLARFLTNSSISRRIPSNAIPNQFYSWSMEGIPFQNYFAGRVHDASNFMAAVVATNFDDANRWVATNATGHLRVLTNPPGMAWIKIPFINPFIRASEDNEFVWGGFFPPALTNRPLPAELLSELQTTNLVYYDWEVTPERYQTCIYVGQLLRVLTHQSQIPKESASLQWLQAVSPKLGNCVTKVVQSGPGAFSVLRKASIGLSSIEMHWLADWLESKEFPGPGSVTGRLPEGVPGISPEAPGEQNQ